MAASAVHPALTYGPSVNLYIPSTSAALSEYTRGYSQVLERNYVLIGARLSTLSRAIGARAANSSHCATFAFHCSGFPQVLGCTCSDLEKLIDACQRRVKWHHCCVHVCLHSQIIGAPHAIQGAWGTLLYLTLELLATVVLRPASSFLGMKYQFIFLLSQLALAPTSSRY
ncbi:hypothetical protein CC77DRAFT_127437 [Alternaria alternata]|uniref:Uncharacterized protein n=1 Tax=Alternaria alternata TaxID=5599 RepID=A0A177DLQ9_ALTAL|nr:hypothetical protein CC77DRAFT_127437 [Alternaria alternata]KAH6861840.1 hypothetical protein B0T12DRAFT_83578 [Alternaria alternata]OAG20436.1 hypothetical protein CC77DRAFT_127437 [Alternaria alternata]